MFSLYKTNLSNLNIAEKTLQKYFSSTSSFPVASIPPESSSSYQHHTNVDMEMNARTPEESTCAVPTQRSQATPTLPTSSLPYAQTAYKPAQSARANAQSIKKRNKPRKNEHVLIVKVSDSSTTSARDMFKSTINVQKLKVKLTGIDSGRKGSIVLHSSDKAKLEKIKKEIEEKKID